MTTRYLEIESDRRMFIRLLQDRKLPLTVTMAKGGKRTYLQNNTQRLWLSEASEQMGDRTAEEVRGYCKLHGGVPILREENEEFRAAYDQCVRPLTYEHKLALMMVPLDFPVTRLMTTKQKSRYLDWMWDEISSWGVVLTEPMR